MRTLKLALATVAAFAIATPVTAGPTEDFHKLMDDYWAAYLHDNPLTASSVSVRTFDRTLGELSLAEFDRQADEAQEFLTRLRAIPAASLNTMDQSNRAVLERTLDDQVRLNKFGQRQLLYSSLGSYHDFLATMGESIPMRTKADYDNYLARLALVPARMKAYSDMSVTAANEGYTQACEWMKLMPAQVLALVPADATQSPFYGPFGGTRPPAVSAADWAALQAQAKEVVGGPIATSYRSFASVAESQLVPKCRKVISISSQPGGKDYYAALVRFHTTTDLTPDQCSRDRLAGSRPHSRGDGDGREEGWLRFARGDDRRHANQPEMVRDDAGRTAGEDGDRNQDDRRQDARLFRPPAAAALRDQADDRGHRADRHHGALSAGQSGSRDRRQLSRQHDQARPAPAVEIPVLSVHEAVPGHHQQIAIQQELDMPQWRKTTVFFTAFVEGWGLYSERLGIDMGLYDTPQKDMGRLSYQMWRATRLVVDTGIHAKGWDKARAVAYMKDNTALTDANIDAEVNRYISVPGQADAYMIGKRKIEELRARSEKALGDKFDVRRFHDAVLGQGAVPLDALDTQINAWIATEKARP